MTEGKMAAMASKSRPGPTLSSRSGSATGYSLKIVKMQLVASINYMKLTTVYQATLMSWVKNFNVNDYSCLLTHFSDLAEKCELHVLLPNWDEFTNPHEYGLNKMTEGKEHKS